MKIQKILRAQGDYAKKGEDIKDGDVITVLDGGQVVTGDYGDRMVFKVKTRNGDKNLSFNQKSLNNLVDAFGEDSDKWKDKDVKVFMVKAMVSGKFQNIVYLAHPDWIMAEDGSFHDASPEVDDIPIINDQDLPF